MSLNYRDLSKNSTQRLGFCVGGERPPKYQIAGGCRCTDKTKSSETPTDVAICSTVNKLSPKKLATIF